MSLHFSFMTIFLKGDKIKIMSKTSGTEIINDVDTTNEVFQDIPMLEDWEPTDDQVYVVFDNDCVKARYDKYNGLHEGNKLSIYVINKRHYQDRMDDICKVINYFTTYFDKDMVLYNSMMAIKFIIDQKTKMSIKAFNNRVIKDIVTDSFIKKISEMTNYLYTINIDTDAEGKYKSTPKITNIQAKMIVAVSFAIRCVLPLCVHYADTNNNFPNKTDYIKAFDKLFTKIVKKFEKDSGIEILNTLSRFVKYRVDRAWSADIGICQKKKQLYGDIKEIYLENIIHEVILVKSLYKLDYNRSVVSFIDGVFFLYHKNYKIENFKFKPVEIDPADQSNDDDDNLSHAEAIEMSVYRIDESNSLINEVNTAKVIKDIEKRFNINISKEEFQFYDENVRISSVTQLFLETFYTRFFHDSNAIYELNRYATVELLIYMKKYLQLRGMQILPQLCTAKVKGKYKENTIKNSKFLEKITTSSRWQNIIEKKFTYINELNQKENPIIKDLSSFVNSSFEFVDYNGEINDMSCDDLDQDKLIDEFSTFLSII